jgi:hypothetical protein
VNAVYSDTSRNIYTTDNGSVVFRILVNLTDNSDRFLMTVDVVAFAELTVAKLFYLFGATMSGIISTAF